MPKSGLAVAVADAALAIADRVANAAVAAIMRAIKVESRRRSCL
jgi:hypothetical protein